MVCEDCRTLVRSADIHISGEGIGFGVQLQEETSVPTHVQAVHPVQIDSERPLDLKGKGRLSDKAQPIQLLDEMSIASTSHDTLQCNLFELIKTDRGCCWTPESCGLLLRSFFLEANE